MDWKERWEWLKEWLKEWFKELGRYAVDTTTTILIPAAILGLAHCAGTFAAENGADLSLTVIVYVVSLIIIGSLGLALTRWIERGRAESERDVD